jgi:hypothetical protein
MKRDSFTNHSDMCAIGDKDRVDASLLTYSRSDEEYSPNHQGRTSLMEEKHIVQHRRTQGHEPAETDAIHGTTSQKCGKCLAFR